MHNFKKFSILFLILLLCAACNQKRAEQINSESKQVAKDKATLKNKSINWIDPQFMEKQGFFPKYDREKRDDRERKYYEDKTDYYKIGEVSGGQYDKSAILLVICQPYMSYDRGVFRFIKQEEQYILIDKYSDKIVLEDFAISNVTLETPEILRELFARYFDIPAEIAVNNSELVLEAIYIPPFFEEKNLISVDLTGTEFVDLDGRLFVENNIESKWNDEDERFFKSNGFFLKMPDNTTQAYSLKIPFYQEEETSIPQIIWNDSTENKGNYLYSEGTGCGYRKGAFANVVKNSVQMSSYAKKDVIASGFPDQLESLIEIPFSDSDLEVAGYALDGKEPIYTFKDKNHPVLKGFYEKNFSIYFSDVNEGEDWLSYEDYLQEHPFFFWDDPFGRRIMFISYAVYMPPACGAKPVIYFYPEKEQKINVQLQTSRKLFVSYPEYKDGWNVLADTESNLFDLHSKESVPYLFWEDLLTYSVPSQGFIVKKENIAGFLEEKLAFIGLNQKEINDFKEFWIPKMQGNPFYFITFLQTEEMNKIAPLQIDPKPDNLIRVFMHFEGLQETKKIEELLLLSNTRDGFTAVEWGGRLQ